jgi:hypothetical protein
MLIKGWHLVSASQRLSSWPSSWVRVYHVCHPEGHVSFNFIDKFIPKPKLFTKARTHNSFRCCGVCFYNFLFETKNFVLGADLPSYLVSELQKNSSLGIEPRTIFRSSSLCFCHLLFETNNFLPRRHSSIVLSFRATGNALDGNRIQDTFPEF